MRLRTKLILSFLLLSDFDGRNDIDVFLADAGGAQGLYMNLRDGTFAERAARAGLRTAQAAAACSTRRKTPSPAASTSASRKARRVNGWSRRF